MKVKAIRKGYYGLSKRLEGVEFELNSEKDFSGKWMIAVDGQEPKVKKQEPKQKSKVAVSVADTEVI